MARIPQKFPTKSADRALAGMLGPVTCIIQLELSFGHALEEKRLARAVHLITQKVPLLGCCFVPKKFRPYFKRLEIERFELFHLTMDTAKFEAFRNKRMDFLTGPQIETCLLRSESEDRFLIKVSHLVCDAAGVKEISRELAELYNRLKDEPKFVPEPILKNDRGFWQVVRSIPWYGIPRIIYNYLCEIYRSSFPKHSHVLPIGKATRDEIQLYTRHIDAKRFARLCAYAREKYITLNDVLITAIIRALSKTGDLTPDRALRLGMAVDMRRYLPEAHTRSIANLSSLEVFNYGKEVEKDFEATLIRVNQIHTHRKLSWLGLSSFISTYPMLWCIPFSILKVAASKGLEMRSSSLNSFDWLTNMGVIQKEEVAFDGEPSTAWLLVPGCVLPMLFFGCSSYNGELTFSWSIGSDESNEEITLTFFDFVISELEAAIGHSSKIGVKS